MGSFSVKVLHKSGRPASDIGVMIYYGLLSGTDKKRTNSDGWVHFHNHGDVPGDIWVDGHDMGNHSLSNGKTYSFYADR